MREDIPVVDFTKCGLLAKTEESVDKDAITKAGNALFKAFTTSGFAYISNHGIPMEAVDEFNRVMEDFFTGPDELKRKYYLNSLDFGYDPIGTLRSNAKREYDYHEGFRITGNAIEDENTPWPDNPEFKKRTLELARLCKDLSLRILKAIGIGLKLKDTDYLCKCHKLINKKGSSTTLKSVRYPPVPTDDILKPNQFRVADHTDWVAITLLFQDNNGGLQVLTPEEEYVDVPPIPGTIVVNIADTLDFWTGGILKSGMHRVVVPKEENRNNVRRSVVYFVQADDDVSLEEMEFQESVRHTVKPRRVECKTVKEYMDRRFAKVFY